MKPVLMAMFDAAITDGPAPEVIENVWLSALHWREDELWCGPMRFGFVSDEFWHIYGKTSRYPKDMPEPKAALEAAAREQITKWFEEQRG